MNLVTTCPWCGENGVYLVVSDGGEVYEGIFAYTKGAAPCTSSDQSGMELEGEDAAESIEELLKRIREECGEAMLRCVDGCGQGTSERGIVIMLLSRMLYGHDGSAREKMNSVEGAK